MKKYILSLSCLFLLCGCGPIAKATSSNNTLLDKAEFATGVEKSNLTLIEDSIESQVDGINYKVKDNRGNIYRCYFSSVFGVVNSQSLCTKLGNGKNSGGQCNELLRKAGKC